MLSIRCAHMLLIMFLGFPVCAANFAESYEAKQRQINHCHVIKEIIRKGHVEIKSIEGRKAVTNTVFYVLNAAFFIVPYTVLYYQSYLNPDVVKELIYYLPPTSLATYFLTLPKSAEKSLALCEVIEGDIKPLTSLLPDLLRVFEMIAEKSHEKFESEDIKSIHNYLLGLQHENTVVFNFVIDALRVAADQYRHSPEMMNQRLGGDLKLRIVLLYSFLTLLDHFEEGLSQLIDKRPTINVALFDTWLLHFHSYRILVQKCAEELHVNLNLLEESEKQLSERAKNSIGLKRALIYLLQHAQGRQDDKCD